MSTKENGIIEGLLVELLHEEDILSEAALALQQAQIRFEVTSQKYAAVRDVAARHLGRNPGKEWVKEPGGIFRELSGRFRFIHMTPGAAVVAALTEAEEPMSLEQVVEALRAGGFRGALPRVINATLMGTTGVEKTEEGKYRYVEPQLEELPFE
jgi:hypothetical protein